MHINRSRCVRVVELMLSWHVLDLAFSWQEGVDELDALLELALAWRLEDVCCRQLQEFHAQLGPLLKMQKQLMNY